MGYSSHLIHHSLSNVHMRWLERRARLTVRDTWKLDKSWDLLLCTYWNTSLTAMRSAWPTNTYNSLKGKAGCYDRGGSFGLKRFLNDGAPQPKLVLNVFRRLLRPFDYSSSSTVILYPRSVLGWRYRAPKWRTPEEKCCTSTVACVKSRKKRTKKMSWGGLPELESESSSSQKWARYPLSHDIQDKRSDHTNFKRNKLKNPH